MTFEGPGLGLSGMMRVLFQASYVRCCQVILDGLRSERPDLAQGAARALWVPRTSFTSRDQAILVDQTTDASLSSDAVPAEVDWLG